MNLTFDVNSACADMVRDEASDLRICHGNFTPRSGVQWENLIWATNTSMLSVSIDYTQSGESPEVKECNRSGRAQATVDAVY
ncbi:hypothetical protein TcWFU_002795 [Taenia crassiceps]|uniref:DUF5727 domain-containing protein n=1 Tax=Taenia crassiceps TaxID=6207 RepID=A0ABR4Q830_9CEST